MRSASPADRPFNGSQQLPGPFSVWALAFAYAVFMALMLQKLILPIMPELHAGHGLMSNDATIFHDIAVLMAQRIQTMGWSEWRLFPADGITGNVGFLAALYVLFGPDPVWFIPLNAAFHALGALMIYLIGPAVAPGIPGRIGGLIAALLFLAFPSSLVWYGQNHKDAFLIAGTLISLASFLLVLSSERKSRVIVYVGLMMIGLALVGIMRPYMLLVFAAAFLCAWIPILLHAIHRRAADDVAAMARSGLLVAISIAAAVLAPSGHSVISSGALYQGGFESGISAVEVAGWRWDESRILPKRLSQTSLGQTAITSNAERARHRPADQIDSMFEKIDSMFEKIDSMFERVSLIRAHVIISGRKVGAGSIVDGDDLPHSAGEVITYLPRALEVGLFSPFPETWSERPTLPRVIGAMETLLWYLLAPGVVMLVFLKPSKQVFAALVFAAAVLTVLGFVSPNVGTLHRIRYGSLFVFCLAGAIGWAQLFFRFTPAQWFAHPSAAPVGVLAASPGAVLPGRGATMGASATVFLVTAVGYLGLLARDLLLVNTYGFGAQLDSLFAALLLPMFLVSVLSLPLGDALVAGIQRLPGNPGDRLPLIRAAMNLSLLVCGAACLVLFAFAGPIFQSVLTVADSDSAARLVRLAILLLLFSGMAVIGNSVLNALNRPNATAAAQLLVPVFAIAAILAADKSEALHAAVTGMILGQLANIALVFFLCRGEGYVLRPGFVRRTSGFQVMAGNYAWLAVAALVINISNPVNFWFAGKLEIGSVSLWAMGSKLVQLVSGLTAAIMTAVVAPYLAKLVSAGHRNRLRGDIYLMLVVGTWIGILAALIVFGFSEPLVVAAFSGGAAGPEQGLRLASIFKLGALQIPFVFSTILLIKLAAVAEDSSKVVIVAIAGLATNVMLNVALVSDFGVVGMAAAWAGSVAASTVVLLLLTRRQTGLGFGQLIVIVGSWVVLGGFAMSLHLHSMATAVSACILLLIVAYGQWRAYRTPEA